SCWKHRLKRKSCNNPEVKLQGRGAAWSVVGTAIVPVAIIVCENIGKGTIPRCALHILAFFSWTGIYEHRTYSAIPLHNFADMTLPRTYLYSSDGNSKRHC